MSGRNAGQIESLLGEPDTRQAVFDADEKWIWWNYTFLQGPNYPPEIRGRVVHLEIVFRNPSRPHEDRQPYSQWRIDTDFGVRYHLPGSS